MRWFIPAVVVVAALCMPGAVSAGPGQYRKKAAGANEATQAVAGEPISLATGEFYFRKPLLDLGGPIPLRYELYYGSQTDQKKGWDGLPPRFHDNQHLLLTQDVFSAFADVAAGQEVLLMSTASTNYTAFSERFHYNEILMGNRAYVADPETDRLWVFERDPGVSNTNAFRLAGQWDRLGNRLVCEYTNAAPSLLARVSDGLGRELRFAYAPVGAGTNLYLSSVQDHGGRAWAFLYDDAPADNPGQVTLRAIVDPAGGTNRFAYAGGVAHAVAAEVLPRGNTPYTNVYDTAAPSGVVLRQTDALGQSFELQREAYRGLPVEDTRFSVVHPDGTRQTAAHARGTVLSSLVDEAGGRMEFGVPAQPDQVESFTDRLGATTRVTYDFNSGKLASLTDPLGRNTTLTYTNSIQTFTDPDNGAAVQFTFYDVQSVLYADGARETFVVASNGLRRAATDRTTNTTFFAYNARGQLTAVTNPAGGVLTIGYDAAGNVATWGDTDTGVWTNAYDALFRLVRVTAPDGAFRERAVDTLDRITNVVLETGASFRFAYDANGSLTQRIDAAGTALAATNAWTYDAIDRDVEAVDPLGHVMQRSYTWWGALSRLVFADGAGLVFRYSVTRAPSGVEDESGRVLALTADAEGRLTGARSPGGRALGLELNAMGRPAGFTDPAGGRTTFQRDSLMRVTNIVDAVDRPLSVGYDAEGRVRRVTLPVIGSSAYAFDRNGALTNATDPRGQRWSMTRTPMGRLAGLVDPDGNAWEWTLDALGRVAVMTAPDGVRLTNRYDAAGLLTNQTYSTGLSLAYAYDPLGRLRSTGSLGVELEYDRGGRVTNTVFNGARLGVTYDVRDRIVALDYDGRMTVQYRYDVRGLVTQVTDSATSAWTGFEYDDDRFLVRITRSNGVTTEFARDANGAVTNLSHGNKGAIAARRDPAGRIVELLQDLPLDVQALVADEVQAFAHDGSGRIAAAGFAFDACGRRTRDPQRGYTWDAAGRLTSISNATGVVSNEYTALGDLARQARPGATNEYFHQYAMPGRPMLAEKRNGAYVRLYVHQPNGRLLYHVDVTGTPAVRFHHFNPAGTTLFLTDAAGSVSDSYGYTVYGRLLQHNGPSGQPFGYIGEFGVREEAGTALVQMRARWYDMLTARFLSRDPLWMETVGDPLQISPYSYALGDPVQFNDPSGLQPPGVRTAGPQQEIPGKGTAPPMVPTRTPARDVRPEVAELSGPPPHPLDIAGRNGLNRIVWPSGAGVGKYRGMVQTPEEHFNAWIHRWGNQQAKRRQKIIMNLAVLSTIHITNPEACDCDLECQRAGVTSELAKFLRENPWESEAAIYHEAHEQAQSILQQRERDYWNYQRSKSGSSKSLLDLARLRDAAAGAVRSPLGAAFGVWLVLRLGGWAVRRRRR